MTQQRMMKCPQCGGYNIGPANENFDAPTICYNCDYEFEEEE